MNSLLELLSSETVQLKKEAKDWQAAVRIAGIPMVKNNSISEEYIDAAIEASTEVGPYYVIYPGVALSHARPGEHVNQLCVSLLTLNTPVDFGHPSNDPVHLVIMFAALDNESHLQLLRDISKLLCNPEAIDKLFDASTYEEAYMAVKEGLMM